jgi:hypothetical protein
MFLFVDQCLKGVYFFYYIDFFLIDSITIFLIFTNFKIIRATYVCSPVNFVYILFFTPHTPFPPIEFILLVSNEPSESQCLLSCLSILLKLKLVQMEIKTHSSAFILFGVFCDTVFSYKDTSFKIYQSISY